jgi:hypothetical protein
VFEDVKVAVVRTDLVERGVQAIPLIDNFVDDVMIVAKLKPHRRRVPGPWNHSAPSDSPIPPPAPYGRAFSINHARKAYSFTR